MTFEERHPGLKDKALNDLYWENAIQENIYGEEDIDATQIDKKILEQKIYEFGFYLANLMSEPHYDIQDIIVEFNQLKKELRI